VDPTSPKTPHTDWKESPGEQLVPPLIMHTTVVMKIVEFDQANLSTCEQMKLVKIVDFDYTPHVAQLILLFM
jgi:hypothetical protein